MYYIHHKAKIRLIMFDFSSRIKQSLSAVVLTIGFTVACLPEAIAANFSIREIAAQIAKTTNIPILLPSEELVERYKFDEAESIYLDTLSSDSDYSVRFNNRSGNVGNVAFRFLISAKRGKDFERRSPESNPAYSPKFSQVRLSDNSNALVTSWCGGTACWSTVQWKSNGILYRVASKKRQPDTALAIANSAIKEGDRRSKVSIKL